MDNRAVARVLRDIATLLQAKGDSIFKARAYTRAADSIEDLEVELSTVVHDQARLMKIPGFGDAIVSKVREMVLSGQLEYYEKLKNDLPIGVLMLSSIPGIGPKTAFMVATELGISTREQLMEAIESGAFARLPRMGSRNAQNILRHLQERILYGDEVSIGTALPIAESVIAKIEAACPGVRNLMYAGSIRRGCESIADVTLVCSADRPQSIIAAFVGLPEINDVMASGTTNASVVLADGMQVDLEIVPEVSFGSSLLHLTGSKLHEARIRDRAQQRGLSLDEHGAVGCDGGATLRFSSEEEIYQELGLQFIPAELREDSGEIEAAETGTLPIVLERVDIQGDLHSHTDWTDGHAPLEEMVAEAIRRGLKFLAITDHSQSATVANGLNPERLDEHNRAVRRLAEKSPEIELLAGTEMDILADGSLDYSDDVLAQLDIVLGSIHSAMDQDRATMTERIIRAMRSEHLDVIAHLTTRLIGERFRAPVEVDLEAVFQAAIDTGTVMEINGSAARLDLRDSHVRMARDMGVVFSIGTDSHRPVHFDFMRYGVINARRGWCEKWRVINTMSPTQIRHFLSLQKLKRYDYARSLD